MGAKKCKLAELKILTFERIYALYFYSFSYIRFYISDDKVFLIYSSC